MKYKARKRQTEISDLNNKIVKVGIPRTMIEMETNIAVQSGYFDYISQIIENLYHSASYCRSCICQHNVCVDAVGRLSK